MTDEFVGQQPAATPDPPEDLPPDPPEDSPPERPEDAPPPKRVGSLMKGFLLVYLVAVSFTLLLILSLNWPQGDRPLAESSMLLLVAASGALGSTVHTLRSLYWYIGNRMLFYNWVPMYLLRPVVGATLGLVFYLVVRAGFFSPDASVAETSPFGFAALAALVGMFSEQAILKLKEIAETLLKKPDKGESHAQATDDS